jgi:hypothetical protein
MRYPGFCGPSNVLQSPRADCERTINWYLEPAGGSAVPGQAALYPTPGMSGFIGSLLMRGR